MPPHTRAQIAGNIFKMSRNKDKYENNNPRRQQVFMSPEDVAAGRKTNWHGVEITGELRRADMALNDGLMQFRSTLQGMYAIWALHCGNSSIWPLYFSTTTICCVCPVTSGYLSIWEHWICPATNCEAYQPNWASSSNCGKKLRDSAIQITRLLIVIAFSRLFRPNRELLLNNNLLRVLPFEIGKLFQLHILGIHGNPLGKDILSIYNEVNGTQKLLTYMLDSLSSKSIFIIFIPSWDWVQMEHSKLMADASHRDQYWPRASLQKYFQMNDNCFVPNGLIVLFACKIDGYAQISQLVA